MQAAIFDMDGLLIDSEPLWRRAERHVFGSVGLTLTDDMCKETMGLRADEFVAHWYQRFPWQGKTQAQVAEEILAQMEQLIVAQGVPLSGVEEVLALFQQQCFKIGLASSSPYLLIHAVVDKLGIRSCFQVLRSAVDETHGKPHPAVYLTTARDLSVEPSQCVVFEDSLAGVQAAKAAGMKVVAVPAPDHYEHDGFKAADVMLRSLREFSMEMI